jgi:asparagine synthase (glutamine-hydrolysing)
MCGISGYISNHRLDDEKGEKMVASLRHRGPDYCSQYQDVILGKNIFLGHNRLSIIDLSSAGHQPMFNQDKSRIIIYNGEIYNYIDLKNKNLKHYSFRSKTDTEVLLYLYDELGIDCVKKLNGDFALSILDKQEKKLYLVRDRLGIKPLYYYYEEKTQTLIFASEIKALLSAGMKPELAEEYLQMYFVFKYVPGSGTLYKNIQRLTPGCYLVYDLITGSIEIKRYWTLKKNDLYQGLSYKEAQYCLFDLVKDAVEIRLMADVPVGTFLSGGIDSSIIAYFLKEHPEITHYCARKSESDLEKEGTTSDFYYASCLAKEWNIPLVEIGIGKNEASSEMLKKVLFYSDDLIADGSQIPSYLITTEAGKNSKVILSGMGADELFFGYTGHQLTLMSLRLDLLPCFIALIIAKGFKKLSQGRGHFLAYRRYLHRFGKYYSYPSYKYGFYDIVGDFENSCSVYKGNKEKVIQFFKSYFPGEGDIFDLLFQYELDNFLVKNLHYVDRMSMANSVENRVPFLDHRLVEFAYSIKRKYKLSSLRKTKRILKDTFRLKLPPYILKRRKAGFGMPLRSIFSVKDNIDRLLEKDFFTHFHGFSPGDIDRIINHHVSGKEDNSTIIFALISFQEWYKMNFG